MKKANLPNLSLASLTLEDLEKMDNMDACRWALMKSLSIVYEDIGEENHDVYRKRSAHMAQWGGYALGRMDRTCNAHEWAEYDSDTEINLLNGAKGTR